jgi:hypothetical protein
MAPNIEAFLEALSMEETEQVFTKAMNLLPGYKARDIIINEMNPDELSELFAQLDEELNSGDEEETGDEPQE